MWEKDENCVPCQQELTEGSQDGFSTASSFLWTIANVNWCTTFCNDSLSERFILLIFFHMLLTLPRLYSLWHGMRWAQFHATLLHIVLSDLTKIHVATCIARCWRKLATSKWTYDRALRSKIWGAFVAPGKKDSCVRDCHDVGCHGKSRGRKALRAT